MTSDLLSRVASSGPSGGGEARAIDLDADAKSRSIRSIAESERPWWWRRSFSFSVSVAPGPLTAKSTHLDTKFDLARISQPFLRELADLRDGSAAQVT